MRAVMRACMAALGLWVSACGTRQEDPRRVLLTNWGERLLLPSYAELEMLARELDQHASELCEQPDASRLQATREAWWAARAPLKRAEVFAFGPYTDEPLRLGAKIDFWPARPESVEARLQSAEPPDAQLLGAAEKGLPAIEYLLFGNDSALWEGEEYRCVYLLLLTSDLVAQVGELYASWSPEQQNYLGELVDAGARDTDFSTLHEAFAHVVSRPGFLLEATRLDKLGRPLGLSGDGSPQPDKVESPFSGRSLEDIRDNVRGTESLFFGTGARPELTLDNYIRSRGRDLSELMRRRFSAAYAALDAVELPLTTAVVDEAADVRAVVDRLGELQQAFQVDVNNALSVNVAFGGNDGD